MNESKTCRVCGEKFYPSPTVPLFKWDRQYLCSDPKCAGSLSSASSRKYKNTTS